MGERGGCALPELALIARQALVFTGGLALGLLMIWLARKPWAKNG